MWYEEESDTLKLQFMRFLNRFVKAYFEMTAGVI